MAQKHWTLHLLLFTCFFYQCHPNQPAQNPEGLQGGSEAEQSDSPMGGQQDLPVGQGGMNQDLDDQEQDPQTSGGNQDLSDTDAGQTPGGLEMVSGTEAEDDITSSGHEAGGLEAGGQEAGGQEAGGQEDPPADQANMNFDYPPLSSFQQTPSDRFLTDIETIVDGHAFRGANANRPHQGAHIYFNPSYFEDYQESGDLETLPKIYAIADGVVGRIELYFSQRTGNYRYGLLLNFAELGGEVVNINYSIEPFMDPQDPTAFETFLLVNEGDQVTQGQVIAYMYSSTLTQSANCESDSCEPSSQNAHIHFELNGPQGKMNPAIFTENVALAFREAIRGSARDKDCSMGDCEQPEYMACSEAGGMGFQLTPEENPFGDEAVTCQ